MNPYLRLEELMKEKDFAGLSISEKKWVSQYITASDYDHQRGVLLSAITELSQAPLPPKQLEDQLIQAFREHHASPSLFSSKPFKFTAGIAAILSIFMLGRWSSPNMDPILPEIKTTTIYKTKTDTVFIEKATFIPRIVTKEKIIRDTVYLLNKMEALPVATTMPETMPLLELGKLRNNSSTVKDEQKIYELLVDVY